MWSNYVVFSASPLFININTGELRCQDHILQLSLHKTPLLSTNVTSTPNYQLNSLQFNKHQDVDIFEY